MLLGMLHASGGTYRDRFSSAAYKMPASKHSHTVWNKIWSSSC